MVSPVHFSALACWPSRGPRRRVRSSGATLTPPLRRARDLQPRPSLTSALLGRRLRSNQAVITMRAADKGEEEQRGWACIMFEGMEVCGPSRFEDGSTCVFNGQRWVCA